MEAQSKNSYRERLVILGKLLAGSFKVMKSNDPLRMAGATAFFTTFALPPILIILFQIFSLFLSRRLVGSEMMELLTNTLGKDSALQIRQTTAGFRSLASNAYIAILVSVFLLFVATTLFSVIKNTLNDLWNIKVKEKPGILFKLKLRARSAGAILLAGILFLAGILIEGVEVLAGDYLGKVWPAGARFFASTLSEVISIVVVTTWFVALFRYIADARPSWKVALAGGVLTGVLFSIGKEVLSYLMRQSNVSTLYGASGSIVLILLFVFYSSFILYFGASFIRVYSEALHQPLRPIHKAYRYQLRKIN